MIAGSEFREATFERTRNGSLTDGLFDEMARIVRDILIVVKRELSDFSKERAVLAADAFSAVALPLYLGRLAASVHLAPARVSIWVLMIALAQVFIVSTSALQALALEREHRTLAPLLMTPLSERAIFLGKTLPTVAIAVFQGVFSVTLFLCATHFSAHWPVALADWGSIALAIALTVSTAFQCAGWGVVVGSLIRSSRATGLAVTLLSLAFSAFAANLGLWALADPLGREFRLEVILTQPALGLGMFLLAASMYRRTTLLARIW